jgi:hypothetical protein
VETRGYKELVDRIDELEEREEKMIAAIEFISRNKDKPEFIEFMKE